MSVQPPQGLNEADYETIEAAVTETVRGRWFLAEFARRNRTAEMRQILDAMGRIEAGIAAGQTALPSVDPSIRLLVQRIKEIAASLGETAHAMRAAGLPEAVVEQVEAQARAVAGMMRAATPSIGANAKPAVEARPAARQVDRKAEPSPPVERRLPRAELPAELAVPTEAARLASLADIDALPLAQKLAIFR